MILSVTPDQVLYGYGPLGVGVVVLVAAVVKLFLIFMKDRDKAIADRDAMVQEFFTKVFPAITRNTDVLEAGQAIDREYISAIKDFTRQLEHNTEAFKRVELLLLHGRGNSSVGGS